MGQFGGSGSFPEPFRPHTSPSLPTSKTPAVSRKTRSFPQTPIAPPAEGRTGIRSICDLVLPLPLCVVGWLDPGVLG